MKRVIEKLMLILILGFVFFFLIPHYLWAQTWEYYTYGGFNAVVDAWRKVGLIFSDSRFVGLYFSVIALGIIILYFVVLIRSTISGSAKFDLAAWAIPVLIGMAIYIALIVPKDRIVVYDPVLNRGPETIGNIPKIMAVMAGVLNKIERGMIDIVKTTTTPIEDYTRNAGGTGFIILSQFGDPVAILPPMYVRQTAYQFIHDCVLFELGRPNSNLTIQDITQGKVSFVDVIMRSLNRGVPTVYYDRNGRLVDTENGEIVTCSHAGLALYDYIRDPAVIDETIKNTCVLSGFNIDNPAEWVQCKRLVESAFRDGLRASTFGNGNLNLLAVQALFAQALTDVLHSINPESGIKIMATREAGSQYLGLVIHANTWLPIIKETLRAVSIALAPFVLLFAATPLVGRALGFLLGMMVWLVSWTVIDAILHHAAVSQAVAASKEFSSVIHNGTPGTMFFALLPSYSAKVAATFGAIRWAGLGLATVFTAMLIRFGGAALALVAGSITGTVQSAGAAMGRMVTDITSPIRADLVPTASWTGAAFAAGGIAPLAEGLVRLQGGSLAGQSDAGRYLDFQTIRTGTAASTVEPLRRGATLGVHMAAEAGRIEGERKFGEVSRKLALEKKYGPGLFATLGALGAEREVEMSLGEMDVARAHRMSLGEFYRKLAHGARINIDTYQEPYGPMMLLTPIGYVILQRPPGFFSISSQVSRESQLSTSHEIKKNATEDMSKSREFEKSRSTGWETNEAVHYKSEETNKRGHTTTIGMEDGTRVSREDYSNKHASLTVNPGTGLKETSPMYQGGGGGKVEGGGGGRPGGGGKQPTFTYSREVVGGGSVGISSGTTNIYQEYSGNRNTSEAYRERSFSNTTGETFRHENKWGEMTTSSTRTRTGSSFSESYGIGENYQIGRRITDTTAFNIDNLALKIYADTHPELSKLPERERYAEAEKRLQAAFYTGNKEEIQKYYEAVNIARRQIENVMPQPAQEVLEQGPEVEKTVKTKMDEIKNKVNPPPKPKKEIRRKK